jgi:MarR-like DNA-binding transcriptional regulator SgrR of sgrS sRNA
MRRSLSLLLAAASVLLPAPLGGAMRPHYGGTLRVVWRARLGALDVRQWPADPAEAAAMERAVTLVFDRLVRLDENGAPEPELALSWSHDRRARHWIFHLRPGVEFSDGTPLTAEIVAGALQFPGLERSITVTAGAIVIQSPKPMHDLLAELASPRHSIFRLSADGSLIGTGPFRVTAWQPRSRAVFTANERDWRGRAFLDGIEIQMGMPLREQRVALELGSVDLAEIKVADARSQGQFSGRIWTSTPVELMAIVFLAGRPAAADASVREALARALDRETMRTVLLQKQGESAGGLLPEWLTGYAFLLAPGNAVRTRKGGAGLSPTPHPLVLTYDEGDALAQAVAERVSVDAREASIAVQVSARPAGGADSASDARLIRLRIRSAEPRRALSEAAAALGLELPPLPAAPSAEEMYRVERALVESYQVIPLFHLPELAGLSARVKNWQPTPAGEWRLDALWLEPAKP